MKTIFTQLWNRRRSYLWIWIELTVVSVLLWYVVDFLYCLYTLEHQPKGYDTAHVYHISVGTTPDYPQEADPKMPERIAAFHALVKRIADYPGVESACYYQGSIVYQNGYMIESYTTDSLRNYRTYVKYVSPTFFDVFRVPVEAGSVSHWENERPILAVVSQDLADSLFHSTPSVGKTFFSIDDPDLQFKVCAVAPKTKLIEYEDYAPSIYTPYYDSNLRSDYGTPAIAIRVRPEAEHGFADRFTADNKRLEAGPYYFSAIIKYDDIKWTQNDMHAARQWMNTMRALGVFFLFNVFLGILGTFWFNTQKRRGEVGLRMAMGASKQKIFAELLTEGITLLATAFIPATVICLNIWYSSRTSTFHLMTTYIKYEPSRLVTALVLTLCVMCVAILIGVWYPARQAMSVEPSEALRDDN